MTSPIRPEDALPDGVESRVIGGTTVRKGSVAAFVANASLLDQLEVDSEQYRAVVRELRNLVPALTAVGVLKIFRPRSERLARIIGEVSDRGPGADPVV